MNTGALKEYLLKKGSALFLDQGFRGKSTSAFLFHNPAEVLEASDKKTFNKIITRTEKLLKTGLEGFVVADYETSYFLINRLMYLCEPAEHAPLKIYLYNSENIKRIRTTQLDLFSKELQDLYSVDKFKLNVSLKEYIKSVSRIRSYIEEGDTYQVNYTVKGKFKFSGDPFSFFSSLLFNQSASYSALINDGIYYIISLSPELFFSVKDETIITRPMKGTIKRGNLPDEDENQKEILLNSEKERSENLMIVDLLRNDLGRICRYGSVVAKDLFIAEKYESLYQMVSEIRGKMRTDVSLKEILKNIFPCGSVTGAPKIRTMELIHKFEKEKRGIYTGSIGLLLKDRKVFNVAIRTLKINISNGNGEIGLGSGIVWDSKAEKEYEEVILKSSFLTSPIPYFELIETMLLNNGEVLFMEEHLERLEYSAGYFLFRFDKEKLRNKILKEISKYSEGRLKIRLLLKKEGKINISFEPFESLTPRSRVIISGHRSDPSDKFLYHKTTNRKIYDIEYQKYRSEGFDEVIYFNIKNELTEGSRSNIFVRIKDNWYTPPLSCGLLPGVFRKFLLCNMENIFEKEINLNELYRSDEMMIVNSLKGKSSVAELYYQGKRVKEFT